MLLEKTCSYLLLAKSSNSLRIDGSRHLGVWILKILLNGSLNVMDSSSSSTTTSSPTVPSQSGLLLSLDFGLFFQLGFGYSMNLFTHFGTI